MITKNPITAAKILLIAKSLPVGTQIMARLHAMLTDVNSGLPGIAELVKRDASLTARIIRIANSPNYGHGAAGIGTIEEALQRVGFAEVFRLVGVVTNASLADGDLVYYGITGAQFQSNNLCAALVSERLALKTGANARIAYTCGLLQGIGRLILDRVARDAEGVPDRLGVVGEHGCPLEWERHCFGFNHLDAARLVLGHWGFPDVVVQAAGYDPSLGLPPTALTRMLKLTNAIVGADGYGLGGEEELSSADLEGTDLTMEDVIAIKEESVAAMLALNGAL
jgi:HD-like signal output (HDOD) protein